MHALILVGSPERRGRTARAVEALTRGLTAGGATAETVWLTEEDLRMCNQVGPDGFGDCLAKGVCKLPDGFAPIVERLRAADLAVFATPVYWGDLSERMRAFVDRLRRICLHADGKRGIAGKPAFALCVAGGGGGGSFHCADVLNRVLGHCDLDILDVVPARRQNFELKLQVLETSGRWLAAAVQPVPASPA